VAQEPPEKAIFEDTRMDHEGHVRGHEEPQEHAIQETFVVCYDQGLGVREFRGVSAYDLDAKEDFEDALQDRLEQGTLPGERVNGRVAIDNNRYGIDNYYSVCRCTCKYKIDNMTSLAV
jgi:hypothetical protein